MKKFSVIFDLAIDIFANTHYQPVVVEFLSNYQEYSLGYFKKRKRNQYLP